jgi:hypothetical protein
LCGLLAWLEDDPEVATALIEQSLTMMAGPDLKPGGSAFLALNALELAVVTGSDDLAESYYQRFSDGWDGYVRLVGSRYPHASAWLERRKE